MTSDALSFRYSARTHLLWLLLAMLVALGYLFGLGGDHIPRSGDELVYAHIARLTAASGHWLPLVSSFDFMRNTKPPLLFWQALLAGDWGTHWTLLRLRLPSVVYTWGTALMVGALAWKITGDKLINCAESAAASAQHALTVGALAAIIYLSFFSTYRYGRSYLTSAPETFWLFGIFFVLAWSPQKHFNSVWKFPLLAGLALGLGCLYKSFVMVVPVGLGLALCYQLVGARQAPWQLKRPGVLADATKVLALCLLALSLFSLWFVLDPQPGEVWREFVVGENAGKMNAARGYWTTALGGNSGILTILTGYYSNAVFLAPVALGCSWAAWHSYRQRRGSAQRSSKLSDAEKIMWLWLLCLALVFTVPSQRSTRYLIPAMPALAVLMALYWQNTGRIWFGITLLLNLLGIAAMAWVAYGAVRATQNIALYSPLFWSFLIGLVLVCVMGMFKRKWTRPAVALSCFGVFIALAGARQPFNGDMGEFSAATRAQLQGQSVAVPSNFKGHFERYAFILPGAHILPYFAAQPVDYDAVPELLKTQHYVLVQRRVGQTPCSDCRIIDVRWDLRSRQDEKEGTLGAFRSPETFWFSREYLVAPLAYDASLIPQPALH